MRHLRRSGVLPLARGALLVDAPVAGVRLERVVRRAADRQHADAVLAGRQGAGRRARGGDRHLHHRLRVALELEARLLEVEPVGLLGDRAALHQLHDDVERFVELAPLVLGLEPHLDGIVDERARPDAEHGPPARHVVELHQAAGDGERVVVGQRHDAGAEADVAGALGGGGDKHLGAGNDLETRRMVLADPGLVVVEPVEMLQQLHVAVDRQQRVLVQGMEGGEEDAGLQVSVVHGAWASSRVSRSAGIVAIPRRLTSRHASQWQRQARNIAAQAIDRPQLSLGPPREPVTI